MQHQTDAAHSANSSRQADTSSSLVPASSRHCATPHADEKGNTAGARSQTRSCLQLHGAGTPIPPQTCTSTGGRRSAGRPSSNIRRTTGALTSSTYLSIRKKLAGTPLARSRSSSAGDVRPIVECEVDDLGLRPSRISPDGKTAAGSIEDERERCYVGKHGCTEKRQQFGWHCEAASRSSMAEACGVEPSRLSFFTNHIVPPLEGLRN